MIGLDILIPSGPAGLSGTALALVIVGAVVVVAAVVTLIVVLARRKHA